MAVASSRNLELRAPLNQDRVDLVERSFSDLQLVRGLLGVEDIHFQSCNLCSHAFANGEAGCVIGSSVHPKSGKKTFKSDSQHAGVLVQVPP